MNGARIFGRRISQAKQNGVKGITTKDKPDPQWLIDYKAKVLKMDFSKVKTPDSVVSVETLKLTVTTRTTLSH